MNNPLISVILPVRNGIDYIKEAIDSVLAQTYPHFELVVVDASDDSTPEIVRTYTDARIKYFRQKTKGSCNGYNEALDNYINGEYVIFIHHDDVYVPDKLWAQLRMLQRYSDADCAYHDIEFVDRDLQHLSYRKHEEFYHRNNDLMAVMMIGYGIANRGMSVLIKRSFIERHNLRYSVETPICCDHEMIFQMIDAGAVFKHVNRYLLKYRIHNENDSGDPAVVNAEDLKIYARYSLEHLYQIVQNSYYSKDEKNVIMGKIYFRLGYNDLGINHFKLSLKKCTEPWAAFCLGTNYYRYVNDYINAETYLRMAYNVMPYRAEIANNLGCSLYMTGKPDKAYKLFKHALELSNDDSIVYNVQQSEKGKMFIPNIIDREMIL